MPTVSNILSPPARFPAIREAQRLQKRGALLRAAVCMFNERGYHATSLDDVAASLGVTKPVIYHHLGNKDQVLFECVSIGLEQLQEAADRPPANGGNGLDRLRTFLIRYAEVMMGEFGMCVARTSEEQLSPPTRTEFRRLKRKIDYAMRQMIRAAAADGSASVSDVRLTTFALAGALNWTARWFRPNGEMSASATADGMVLILCAGLAPRQA